MRISTGRAVAFLLGVALVVGSTGFLLQAEPPQAVGTWASIGTADPQAARTGAAVATLADGTTLVAGGLTAEGAATDSVVIHDPLTNSSTQVGQLLGARVNASATRLVDGRVLITGGDVGGIISSDIEIFDPASGESTFAALLLAPRAGHASALLDDDTVLIVGGTSVDDAVLGTTERFDPATNTVTAAASMAVARTGASVTTLIDGRVLVAGGHDGAHDLASAEIYSPVDDTFLPVETQMSAARSGHAAVLLPHNNSVLIAGGTAAGAAVTTTDLFLPAMFPDPYSWGMGTFGAANPMVQPRSHAVAGPWGDNGYAFAIGGGQADGEVYRFATIKTDKDDYPPGQIAIITGSGWKPGEAVKLVLQEDPAVHEDYVIHLDGEGNPLIIADENGDIYYDQWAPEEHDLNVRFYMMATGQQSQRRAQMTFTDAISVSVNPPTFAWHRTGEVAGGFDVSGVQGTYACSTSGGVSTRCDAVTNVTVTVSGDLTHSKVITGLLASGTTWGPVTLEFRTVPGAGQFAIPAPDGKFDVTATLNATYLTTNSRTSNDTENNYFGVDNTKPVTDIHCDGDDPCINPYAENVTVKLFPDDGNAATSSGVDSTLYCVSTAACTPTTPYPGSNGFDVTYVAGATYYVCYFSEDKAYGTGNATMPGGNQEVTKCQAIVFTAVKTDPTLSVTNSPATYNGSPQAAVVTGSVAGTVSDIKYDGSSTVPTNAGTYAVTADFAPTNTTSYNSLSDASAGNFVITPADPACSISGYTGDYDGAAHGATGSCAGVNNEGPLAGLVLGASFTNVPGGTANWVFTAQTANYDSDAGSVEIVITPADPACSISGYTGDYDGAAHGATGSCAGVNNEGPLAGLVLGASFTNVPGGTANWVFTAQTANYDSDAGSVEIVITPADPACSISGYTGDYDGAAHGATGSCAGVNNEGPLAGLVLGASFTNVPGGTANWVFTAQTANYDSDAGSVEIVITPADPVCSISGYTGDYDGAAHGATGSCAGVNNEGPLAGLVLGASFTNVPGGTANWVFTAQTANYDSDAGSVEIVITPADPACSISGYTGDYDGAAHGATGSCAGVNNEGPLAGLVLGASFTNVPGGTANWVFTAQTANYDSDAGSVEIVITPADPVCTIVGFTGAYDAAAHGATGSCTGVDAGGAALGSTLTLGASFTLPPGGTAHWTFEGGTNYLDEAGDVAINITYGTCSAGYGPGGVILQPINSDGTSVYNRKGGSTIPVKFTVCDASGMPISNPAAVFAGTGGVGDLTMLSAVRGTVTGINEIGEPIAVPDVAFRWAGDKWIFNMATSNLTAGTTYTFRINLALGGIQFRVGVK